MDRALLNRRFGLSVMRTLSAVLGGFLLASVAVGCGASESAVTAPSPRVIPPVSAAPTGAAVPVPSDPSHSGTLGPYGGTAIPRGAYFIDLGGYRYTFTVATPAWWTNNYGDWLAVGKVHGDHGPMTRLFVLSDDGGAVFADACHWSGTDSIPGATVGDLVAALAAVHGFEASKPSVTTVGGYPGMHVRLTVPADVNLADCNGGQYHGLGGFWDISPGQVQDIWAFDADGKRRVIWSAFDGNTPPQAQSDLSQLINSLEIEPTPQ